YFVTVVLEHGFFRFDHDIFAAWKLVTIVDEQDPHARACHAIPSCNRARAISLRPHQPGLLRLNQAFIAHRRNGRPGSSPKPSDSRIAYASSVARTLWMTL